MPIKRRTLALIGFCFISGILTSSFFQHETMSVNAITASVNFTIIHDNQSFSITSDDDGRVRQPISSKDNAQTYDYIYRENRVLSSWYLDITLTQEIDFTTAIFNSDTPVYATWLFSNPGSPQYGDDDPFEADITTYDLDTSIIEASRSAFITLDIWLAQNEIILSYRWQMRKDDGVDTYQDIVGATTNRLDITQEGKYRYRCFYTYSYDGGVTSYELKSHAVTLIRAENNPSFLWLIPLAVALILSGGLIYILFFKRYALILHYRDNETIKMWVKANTLYEDIHLPIITKPDHLFMGWAKDPQGQVMFDEPLMPRKEIHLYPIWKNEQKG